MRRVSCGADESLSLTADIARTLRDAAYRASVTLARERRHFPRFDAQATLDGPLVRRPPEDLRADIRRNGIRNSHLLSVATTGPISLAFGRNLSRGIEPAFAWEYTRRSLNTSGEPKTQRMLELRFGGIWNSAASARPCRLTL